jgi:hypothetical protein
MSHTHLWEEWWVSQQWKQSLCNKFTCWCGLRIFNAFHFYYTLILHRYSQVRHTNSDISLHLLDKNQSWT